MSKDAQDTYKEHGIDGLVFEFLHRAYFGYNYITSTDDMAAILCSRIYVTPWTQRSINKKYDLSEKEKKDLLAVNLKSLYHKLKVSDYNTTEELTNLIDPLRECNPKELREELPSFFF